MRPTPAILLNPVRNKQKKPGLLIEGNPASRPLSQHWKIYIIIFGAFVSWWQKRSCWSCKSCLNISAL